TVSTPLHRPVKDGLTRSTTATRGSTTSNSTNDRRVGAAKPPTRNLSGTLPDASDDSLPSKVKEPFVFYGVPKRAGDRGRTGDVQLGKLIDEGPDDYDPWE